MAEPITTTAILAAVANAMIGALAGEVTAALWSKLKKDPAQNALKQALVVAIHRYGNTGSRLPLTRPLLAQNGPLTEPGVAAELAKLVQFDQEPDVGFIGQRWKAALADPPPWRDFAFEAQSLLDQLRAELRVSEVFGPVFDSESLDAIAADAAVSAESLANIEAQMAAINGMLDARFADLIHTFNQASGNIRDQILDYARYIDDKTSGFVGRQWLFDEVNHFIEANVRGYFFIVGDPGIGKSALAAQMVKQNGFVHHFNIRAEGISKSATFLKNVCAQLIAAYELAHEFLPPDATEDAAFLNRLLDEVSGRLAADDRCVIVVDALDEVDLFGLPDGANPLYLPVTVPRGIYFVVTMRKEDDRKLWPRVDCEQGFSVIKHDSTDNLTDITDFVRAATIRPGIRAYISANEIKDSEFVPMIVKKSEGNFMYLRYVLPEIEHGAYEDLSLTALPAGLENYYEDHWRRMRGADEVRWFEYKLPIIVAMTVVQESVSLDLISDFSRVRQRARIRTVLQEWAPFLHEEMVEFEGEIETRYNLYHETFFEFIVKKEDVADERMDLKAAHARIADVQWEELFGDE